MTKKMALFFLLGYSLYNKSDWIIFCFQVWCNGIPWKPQEVFSKVSQKYQKKKKTNIKKKKRKSRLGHLVCFGFHSHYCRKPLCQYTVAWTLSPTGHLCWEGESGRSRRPFGPAVNHIQSVLRCISISCSALLWHGHMPGSLSYGVLGDPFCRQNSRLIPATSLPHRPPRVVTLKIPLDQHSSSQETVQPGQTAGVLEASSGKEEVAIFFFLTFFGQWCQKTAEGTAQIYNHEATGKISLSVFLKELKGCGGRVVLVV